MQGLTNLFYVHPSDIAIFTVKHLLRGSKIVSTLDHLNTTKWTNGGQQFWKNKKSEMDNSSCVKWYVLDFGPKISLFCASVKSYSSVRRTVATWTKFLIRLSTF